MTCHVFSTMCEFMHSKSNHSDEDMTTLCTPLVIEGEIIIICVKQIQCQVNANLSSYYNLEHMAALSSPLLLVELRCHTEEGQTHLIRA